MERQSSMEPASFTHWCRIATKLSNEVHAALIFRNSELAAIQREKELNAFMQLVNGMSPERFTAFIETTRFVFSETVGMKIEPDLASMTYWLCSQSQTFIEPSNSPSGDNNRRKHVLNRGR